MPGISHLTVMKALSTLLALTIGLAAAAAQTIPYFPPFISALPSGRDAAVAHKFDHDRRFSIPSSDRWFIEFVIRHAQADRRAIRTARKVVNGQEFVEIYVSERK